MAPSKLYSNRQPMTDTSHRTFPVLHILPTMCGIVICDYFLAYSSSSAPLTSTDRLCVSVPFTALVKYLGAEQLQTLMSTRVSIYFSFLFHSSSQDVC